MNKMTQAARFLFAIAIAVFGVQHFIYGHFLPDLEPAPDQLNSGFPAYALGFILIVIALGLVTDRMGRAAALLLSVLYLANTLFHLPRVITDLHNGNEWTTCFEALAITSGSLALAGILRGKHFPGSADRMVPPRYERIIRIPPYLFAISLLVFATLHFVYAGYIATLIPSWIPVRLFWSYFVGFAFLAAALSIAIKKKARLACRLLGLMFFFWVVVVHIPRVVASPHKESEWTSCFIALAMGASAWLLAALLPD
jgi:uncharacterized membrane protein